MITERAQGLSNAEGLRADRIAATMQGHNPARAALIREIAAARLAIPDADDALDLFTALQSVQMKRKAVNAGAEAIGAIEEMKAKASINEAELHQGMMQVRRAAAVGYSADKMHQDALELKSRAGEHLLQQRHAKAREDVDALIGDSTHSIATLGEQKHAAIEKVKAHYGGNAHASRAFLDSLESEGAPKQRRTQQTINALYYEWLTKKALEMVPEYRESQEAAERIGREVISHAKAATGISKREAANLGAKHLGSGKGLRGVASRSGWSPKDMDADMVELMQVAGKMLPSDAKIEIGSKADIEKAVGFQFRTGSRGRSFHSEMNSEGIGRVNKTYVVLSGSVSKRTLYHEAGHAVEAVNPAVNAMVSQWLTQRIGDEKPTRLRSLTGVRAYKSSEVAVKDGFIDAYVGKVYKPRQGMQTNEVLAMGLERLADPMAAAQLAAKDPDHLALIMAALQVEYQP